MRSKLILVAFLAAAASAAAQDDCPQCMLGIWDSPSPTEAARYGTISVGTPKSVYLGICLGPGETGLTGIEFSVQGLDDLFIVGTDYIAAPSVALGTVAAPPDGSGTGGLNVAWASCQAGSQALVRIQLFAFATVTNRVLRVARKYPPSSPNYNNQPVMTRCDPPKFTAVRVRGDCYVLNFDGLPNIGCDPFGRPACSVSVEATTWTRVKTLYQN